MSDAFRAALLREVHRSIAETADRGVERVAESSDSTSGVGPTLDYPPSNAHSSDHMLTAPEAIALSRLVSSDAAMSGLRKLLREAAAAPVFHLFCLLDGVADPQDWKGDPWLGADLTPPRDGVSREMLHDEFLERYWAFVESGRDDS